MDFIMYIIICIYYTFIVYIYLFFFIYIPNITKGWKESFVARRRISPLISFIFIAVSFGQLAYANLNTFWEDWFILFLLQF